MTGPMSDQTSNVAIVNEEVSWEVLDITVSGTITASQDLEARAAVIFVAGSGPTDRDWCTPALPGSNGSAKLLAEALARQGIMTLRYDKLASGPHLVENLSRIAGKISMRSHIDEIKGAVRTLIAERPEMKDRMFVLSNSEGAIHAVNYQLQAGTGRFQGLVLTGLQ